MRERWVKDVEIKFCPKCHREAFRLMKNERGYQVLQNGKPLVTLGDNSTCSISIGCPSGHPVKLKIGEKISGSEA